MRTWHQSPLFSEANIRGGREPPGARTFGAIVLVKFEPAKSPSLVKLSYNKQCDQRDGISEFTFILRHGLKLTLVVQNSLGLFKNCLFLSFLFFSFYSLGLCVWVSHVHVYLHTVCIPSAHRVQKKVLARFPVTMVTDGCELARGRWELNPWCPGRSANALNHLSHLSSPPPVLFIFCWWCLLVCFSFCFETGFSCNSSRPQIGYLVKDNLEPWCLLSPRIRDECYCTWFTGVLGIKLGALCMPSKYFSN